MTTPASSIASSRRKELPCTPRERLKCSAWIWEVLSFLVSLLCIGAILIILARFDNKPLPNMGWLTLNGIVSTLAGISKAALILPISEAISQLKWHWFWKSDSPRPISDFQLYDSASRGPWGSLCLLVRPRLAHLSSLGALLTVVALAIEPFLQLVPAYPVKLVPRLDGNATLPSVNYVVAVDRDPVDTRQAVAGPGLKGAIYNGVYGSSLDKGVTPVCSTGNCTWEPYTSLAVCSACANLTDVLHYVPPDDSYTSTAGQNNWQLPNGNFLNGVGSDTMQQSVPSLDGVAQNPDQKGNWSIAYPDMANFSIITAQTIYFAPQTSNITGLQPHAAECVLYFCIKTYHANVVDGKFEETLNYTWPDPTEPLPASFEDQWSFRYLNERNGFESSTFNNEELNGLPQNVTNANITFQPPAAGSSTYSLNWLTLYAVRSWFGVNWVFGINDQPSGTDILQIVYNSYTSDSKSTARPKDLTEAKSAMYNMPGPGPLWSDVADSMTVHIRSQTSGQQSAIGIAYAAETFVSVRWEWTILPIALLILTLAFVGLTVATSIEKQIPLWKSHSLPSLFYSLDRDVSETIAGAIRPAANMEAHAKAYEMAVTVDDNTLRLRARPRKLA